MRRTVTSDPDVQALIQRTMREREVSFDEAVNMGLRNGLSRPQASKLFEQKTFPMGTQDQFSDEKALTAADAIEDEELLRRAYLRAS